VSNESKCPKCNEPESVHDIALDCPTPKEGREGKCAECNGERYVPGCDTQDGETLEPCPECVKNQCMTCFRDDDERLKTGFNCPDCAPTSEKTGGPHVHDWEKCSYGDDSNGFICKTCGEDQPFDTFHDIAYAQGLSAHAAEVKELKEKLEAVGHLEWAVQYASDARKSIIKRKYKAEDYERIITAICDTCDKAMTNYKNTLSKIGAHK